MRTGDMQWPPIGEGKTTGRTCASLIGDTISYSVEELERAMHQPADEYHRHLMRWTAQEIRSLRKNLDETVGIYEEGLRNL